MPTQVGKHRTAAVLTWVPAIGFGLPAVYGAWYLHDRGHVWSLIGFGRREHGNTGRRGSSQRLGRQPEGVS